MATCSPEVASGRKVLLPSPAPNTFSFGASGSQRIIAALQNRTIRLERDLQLMEGQRDAWRKKCQEIGELMLARCARFKKEMGELSKEHDQFMDACSQNLLRLQRTVYSIEGSLVRTADCDSAEGLSHLIAKLGKRNAGLEGEREILLAKQQVNDHQTEMLKNEIKRHTETIRRMEKEYADSQKLRDAYKKMKTKLELNQGWLELKEKQVNEVVDKHKDDEKTVRRYENECKVKDKQIAGLKFDIMQLREQLTVAQKDLKESMKKVITSSSPSSFSNLPTPSSGGASDDSPPDIKFPRLDVAGGNASVAPPLGPNKQPVPFSDRLPPPATSKTEEDNAKLKRHLTQLLGKNLELQKRLEDTTRSRDLDRQRLTQLEAAVNDLKQQIGTSDVTNYEIQQQLETYETEYQVYSI